MKRASATVCFAPGSERATVHPNVSLDDETTVTPRGAPQSLCDPPSHWSRFRPPRITIATRPAAGPTPMRRGTPLPGPTILGFGIRVCRKSVPPPITSASPSLLGAVDAESRRRPNHLRAKSAGTPDALGNEGANLNCRSGPANSPGRCARMFFVSASRSTHLTRAQCPTGPPLCPALTKAAKDQSWRLVSVRPRP